MTVLYFSYISAYIQHEGDVSLEKKKIIMTHEVGKISLNQ